jgi:PEP-CTERM motif
MKCWSASTRVAAAAGFLIAGGLGQAEAQIMGHASGGTDSANALNPHPMNRDDRDVTTTIAIRSLTTSSIITEAARNFKAITQSTALDNLVFAGAPGVGRNFTPIDPSDLFIDVYAPWVVNSNDTTNNLKSPSGKVDHNRDVTDQDAGGVNILFTFTPNPGEDDPTTINFLQAFSRRQNGGAALVYVDNGSVTSTNPYYNSNEATDESSSTDDNDKSSAPLTIPAESDAWMLDVPYVCESGANGMAQGCPETTPQTDETITRLVDTFDVFIEADRTFNGQTYQVLFGGFEWGFTFTATDAPEPSTWAMLGLGFLGLGALALRRQERRLAA